ncbi:MAG: GyrI-like domain-containing protein [Sumerlaeia bacterium]
MSPVVAPEIRAIPERVVLTVTRRGMIDGTFMVAANQAFTALMQHLGRHGLMDAITGCLAICADDPSRVAPQDCRYIAGPILSRGMEDAVEGEFERTVVPAGRWAVFTHRGSYQGLGPAWHQIYSQWLPASGERHAGTAPVEVYLNAPDQVPEDQLLTEIQIPLL